MRDQLAATPEGSSSCCSRAACPTTAGSVSSTTTSARSTTPSRPTRPPHHRPLSSRRPPPPGNHDHDHCHRGGHAVLHQRGHPGCRSRASARVQRRRKCSGRCRKDLGSGDVVSASETQSRHKACLPPQRHRGWLRSGLRRSPCQLLRHDQAGGSSFCDRPDRGDAQPAGRIGQVRFTQAGVPIGVPQGHASSSGRANRSRLRLPGTPRVAQHRPRPPRPSSWPRRRPDHAQRLHQPHRRAQHRQVDPGQHDVRTQGVDRQRQTADDPNPGARHLVDTGGSRWSSSTRPVYTSRSPLSASGSTRQRSTV